MAYVPKHITQADGSPSQWKNCWAAAGAWLADGASRGGKRLKPERFRRKARKPENTTGGLADIARGLTTMKLWKRARDLPDLSRREMRKRFLARPKGGGRLYVAETDFDAYPDRNKCQKGFDGYHMVGIAPGEGRKRNRGKVRVMNPLCRKRMTWVNVDRLIDSIIEYNDEHSGERRNTADLIVVNVPPKP